MSVHIPPEPITCRQCGSLIAPQTVQCRRCGRYRDAGWLENALLASLIPSAYSRMAGTLVLVGLIVLWELIVVIATRGDAFPSASSFSLLQFGAMHGAFVNFGQWWRAGTSIFLHHDLLHLLMNLYALAIVGPILEALVDRYRVWSIFLVGGVASMVISHFWYGLGVFGTPYLYISAGASGAVCALIGATFVQARSEHRSADIASQMLRWSLFMLVIGLMAGGVNNSAHVGGWFVGAGIQALLLRLSSPAKSTKATKILSGIMALLIAVCFAFAGLHMRDLPSYSANDGQSRSMFLLPGKQGVDWSRSDQVRAWNTCRARINDGDDTRSETAEAVVEVCRLNAAFNGFDPVAWRLLELAYRGVDAPKKEAAARRVASQLRR